LLRHYGVQRRKKQTSKGPPGEAPGKIEGEKVGPVEKEKIIKRKKTRKKFLTKRESYRRERSGSRKRDGLGSEKQSTRKNMRRQQ